MRYTQWTTGPFTPRLPIISLPAESPRPVSAIPERQPRPTSPFTSQRRISISTAPAQSFGRNHEYPRAPAAFALPEQDPITTAPARGFDRNYPYAKGPAPASYSSSRTDVIGLSSSLCSESAHTEPVKRQRRLTIRGRNMKEGSMARSKLPPRMVQQQRGPEPDPRLQYRRPRSGPFSNLPGREANQFPAIRRLRVTVKPQSFHKQNLGDPV
ncbi:hypothetical protein B0H12DRAFT_232888 [Mycena haematopus]|nr:hypothetical protein B0H12DRAFT_232888 [Mycena haematopus]